MIGERQARVAKGWWGEWRSLSFVEEKINEYDSCVGFVFFADMQMDFTVR